MLRPMKPNNPFVGATGPVALTQQPNFLYSLSTQYSALSTK